VGQPIGRDEDHLRCAPLDTVNTRYTWLALALAASMAMHLGFGIQGGDFWQHAAAVRELARHPLAPMHPQLLLTAPTPFFTPYTLGAALVSRATGVDAVSTLSALGIVNLVLWLIGLRVFLSACTRERADTAAFYTLVFTLLWWGRDPWLYSGFFHLRALVYVLPYPSTFATAITLIALGANARRVAGGSQLWLPLIALVAGIVVLTHPLTFVFFAIGIAAQVCTSGAPVRDAIRVVVVMSVVGGLCLLWPYFPLAALVTSQSQVFDADNREMYQGVLRAVWPTMVLFGWALTRRSVGWPRWLGAMLAGLCVVYAFGGSTSRYSYGRTLPGIVLAMQSWAALAIARAETAGIQTPTPSAWWRRALPVAALVIGFALSHGAIRAFVHPRVDPSYEFLEHVVAPDAVVLTDLDSGRIVAAYSGRIVAAAHAIAFVAGMDDRKADVERFFSSGASSAERAETLRKYRVEHVLIRKSDTQPWAEVQRDCTGWGHLSYDDANFVVMSRLP
jgi:alpha-1,6-mannosyltransferase